MRELHTLCVLDADSILAGKRGIGWNWIVQCFMNANKVHCTHFQFSIFNMFLRITAECDKVPSRVQAYRSSMSDSYDNYSDNLSYAVPGLHDEPRERRTFAPARQTCHF